MGRKKKQEASLPPIIDNEEKQGTTDIESPASDDNEEKEAGNTGDEDDPASDRLRYREDKEYVGRYGRGYALTSKAGIRGSGDPITPEMFAEGVETFEYWLNLRFIVTKAEYEKQVEEAK